MKIEHQRIKMGMETLGSLKVHTSVVFTGIKKAIKAVTGDITHLFEG